MNAAHDWTGARVGHLTVLARLDKYRPPSRPNGQGYRWRCRCDCGNTAVRLSCDLARRSPEASCGCRTRARLQAARRAYWQRWHDAHPPKPPAPRGAGYACDRTLSRTRHRLLVTELTRVLQRERGAGADGLAALAKLYPHLTAPVLEATAAALYADRRAA